MKQIDLAVDRNEFPIIKREFNPPGKRKFIYIGHTADHKNTFYLSQIAHALTEMEFGWIGSGNGINGVKAYGNMNFETHAAKEIISQFDFLITVGSADGNPTTILESMAWGLIPVCTPQSGYAGYPGIVNIPLNNLIEAVPILKQLQYCPESTLLTLQRVNYEALDNHFNWDRFSRQVMEAIDSREKPACPAASLFGLISLYLDYMKDKRGILWKHFRIIRGKFLSIYNR